MFLQGNIQINATVSFYNFDQHEDSSFQVFLQSDQAGWDNSAKKLKNRINFVFSLYVYQFSTVVLTSHPKSTVVLLGTGTPETPELLSS